MLSDTNEKRGQGKKRRARVFEGPSFIGHGEIGPTIGLRDSLAAEHWIDFSSYAAESAASK